MIFCVTTFSVAIGCLRTYSGLITYQGVVPSDVFFQGFNESWQCTLQVALLVTETLIADYIMIYRCWVVWSYRWRVVAACIILWFANSAIAIVAVVFIASPVGTTAWMATAKTWAITLDIISFSQNIIALGLIAFRLRSADRSAGAYRKSTLMPVVWILVESGALYVATLFVYLIAELTAQYALTLFFVVIFEPLIGITFALIIVRVNLRQSQLQSSQIASNFNQSRGWCSSGAMPIEAVTVTVHRNVASDSPMDNYNTSCPEHLDEVSSAKRWGSEAGLEDMSS